MQDVVRKAKFCLGGAEMKSPVWSLVNLHSYKVEG